MPAVQIILVPSQTSLCLAPLYLDMIFIGVPRKSGPSYAEDSSTCNIPTVTQQLDRKAKQRLEEGSPPNSLLTSTTSHQHGTFAINR